MQKETHYTLVEEPGGDYLTHLTPDGGKGRDIANAILAWLENCSQLDWIEIVGGDSTAVNTGAFTGGIHEIEVGLGRKVLWAICFLHINELPLRHLIAEIDGPTNSDHTFSGPIGKEIGKNVEDLEINPNFQRIISGENLVVLPDHILADLSTDQKYGYMMATMIRSGVIDDSVIKLKPGPICHSRWLTKANR